MSLKKIIYLQSEADFSTLVSTGSLVKDGKTLTYEPDTTDYRVKYTEPTIPVKGVQAAGTDLTPDANGKVNIPLATASEKGLVLLKATDGIWLDGNYLAINTATDAQIAAKTDIRRPITPSNLQLAVDTGVKGSANYTSFTCEMADGTTKTLKLYSELI